MSSGVLNQGLFAGIGFILSFSCGFQVGVYLSAFSSGLERTWGFEENFASCVKCMYVGEGSVIWPLDFDYFVFLPVLITLCLLNARYILANSQVMGAQ